MFGNIGFSYVELIFLILLIIPNIIWTRKQPEGYTEFAKKENKVLSVFEKLGQVLVVTTAVIFSNYNPTIFDEWVTWLIAASVLMILYEITWVRYFIKPTLKNFYAYFAFIPVPLASIPVFAFLLLGIYG